MIGRRNPKPVCEADGTELIVFEIFGGSRKEGIDGGFVDHRAFLKTFALDSPVIAGGSAGYKVNAGILAAEIAAGGEIVPKPNIGEKVGIARIGLQVRLH